MRDNNVVLVDKRDNQIGTGEKMQVHRQGKLHRAFSVLIFNSRGEMLLQERAGAKYHSPGLWTNACCSHPRPGKEIKQEAKRRLKEEMGIECHLKEVFNFIYKAKLGKLTEYEYDHVFVGKFDGQPKPNKEEADDWKWMNMEYLKKDTSEHPEQYTYWFKVILEKVSELGKV